MSEARSTRVARADSEGKMEKTGKRGAGTGGGIDGNGSERTIVSSSSSDCADSSAGILGATDANIGARGCSGIGMTDANIGAKGS
ncbi:MAG: hypothetical protein EXR75_07395 [Myxococcales bacterium]|nr:hypothetical protein [Myxococcales bacterium]